MNNDQEIILAKISAVYDKPPFVKMETGQMEMILKCVGLGAWMFLNSIMVTITLKKK